MIKKERNLEMSTIILNHPLIDHKLTIMRNKETGTKEFRQNLDEIAMLMSYEVTKNLPVQSLEIQTPICKMTGKTLVRPVVLVPILRAGLGLVDGFKTVIPTAKVGHIGMRRNEETLEPEEYYAKFPSCLDSANVIVLDPMLATGGSASAAINNIKKRGAKYITLACLVAAPEGVAVIEENHPDVKLVICALDEKLNDKGYIVPGLGDAGDRLFGTQED
jgi:uracil phosphoribosyltransferase